MRLMLPTKWPRSATPGIKGDYIHAAERPTENLLKLRTFKRIVSQMNTDRKKYFSDFIRVHLRSSVFTSGPCSAEQKAVGSFFGFFDDGGVIAH